MPEWLKTALLVLLLVLVVYKTFSKALRQFQSEQKHRDKQPSQTEASPGGPMLGNDDAQRLLGDQYGNGHQHNEDATVSADHPK